MQKNQQLLNAHVQFILNQCSGETLATHIAEEVRALRQWLSQVTLTQLIDKTALLNTLQKVVVDYPLDGESIAQHRHALFLDIQKALLHAKINDQTTVSAIFSEQNCQQITNKIIDLSQLREQFIDLILNSEIYTHLVSDVLYNGIKDFLLEENILAKLPGVSTMLKMGKWSFNKTLPGLDTIIEKTAKEFIKQHIPRTVELSKKILNKSLAGDSIRTAVEHVWNHLKDQSLNKVQDYIQDQDLVDFVTLSESWWFHYRKSEHFMASCATFIDYWLERQGNKTLIDFVDSLGGDTELLINELQYYVPHWLELAKQQGFLEARIRAWLTPFYESEAAAQLLT